MVTEQNLENGAPKRKCRGVTVFALYSDDDGVVLFDTEQDAEDTKKDWIEAGANYVEGPFVL